MAPTRTERPAKVLLFDIETAPNLGYVWGMWEQNVIDFSKHWYMLSFAYKWLGKKKITTHALPDYKTHYRKSGECDKLLVRDLWQTFDEADIVVAHNGNRFDIRKANARFVAHGLQPPSPYKSIDTLLIARRHFKFDSNKLDDLGGYLGVGRKLPHIGKHLWLSCMRGDMRSWATMKRYNAHDVALLEQVYLTLRPWATTHPTLTNYSRTFACPTCESTNIQHRGFRVTVTGKRRRFQCTDCGAWHSSGKHIRHEVA